MGVNPALVLTTSMKHGVGGVDLIGMEQCLICDLCISMLVTSLNSLLTLSVFDLARFMTCRRCSLYRRTKKAVLPKGSFLADSEAL